MSPSVRIKHMWETFSAGRKGHHGPLLALCRHINVLSSSSVPPCRLASSRYERGLCRAALVSSQFPLAV